MANPSFEEQLSKMGKAADEELAHLRAVNAKLQKKITELETTQEHKDRVIKDSEQQFNELRDAKNERIGRLEATQKHKDRVIRDSEQQFNELRDIKNERIGELEAEVASLKAQLAQLAQKAQTEASQAASGTGRASPTDLFKSKTPAPEKKKIPVPGLVAVQKVVADGVGNKELFSSLRLVFANEEARNAFKDILDRNSLPFETSRAKNEPCVRHLNISILSPRYNESVSNEYGDGPALCCDFNDTFELPARLKVSYTDFNGNPFTDEALIKKFNEAIEQAQTIAPKASEIRLSQ